MTFRNLKSDNVVLRVPEIGDTQALATMANDKSIWDNLRDYFPHPYHIQDAENFIQLTGQEDPPITLAVTFRDELAGIIGLNKQPDVYQKSLEIGYWLGVNYWGKGIASKAVRLITDYAFEQLDCNRLHTGVYSYNPASMRVLEKCGYHKEGIFKQAVWKNQQFWDEHRYALLKPH